MVHSVPVLRVEEWPLPGDSLTSDSVRALVDRVSVYSVCIHGKLFIHVTSLRFSDAQGHTVPLWWIVQVNCNARGGVRFVGSVLQQAGGGRCNGRVASPRRSCRSPPHTPPGDRDQENNGFSQGYTS